MALTADDIIDRRTLRRKISFWRIAAFVLIAALIISLFWASGVADKLGSQNNDHIARVKIQGTITNDEPLLKLLASLKKKKSVKAVILNVSSPGGTTVGGEAIFDAVRDLAETKPVAASVGTLAASAGYMIASASDHIVARRSSIVGSIGVLFQFGDVTKLMEKIGVKIDTVKSSPLKAEPSPFNETTDAERQVLDRLVQDSYKWFVGLVAERRNMEDSEVRKLADGSIYSGAQSLENGLIDAIGGEGKAKEWLTTQKGIETKLEIIEWKPKRPEDSIFGTSAALANLAKILGFEVDRGAAEMIRQTLPERLFLDGLLSIWVSSTGKASEG